MTAVRLLEELAARKQAAVSDDAIRTGLSEVEWPGRLELRRVGDGQVLIDGAHNPGGARALARYLNEAYGRRLPFVIGVMRDKNIEEIVAAMLPSASAFVCTAAASPRAASPSALAAIVERVAPDLPIVQAPNAAAALHHARSLDTPVVVAGSLYLAGEIRSLT